LGEKNIFNILDRLPKAAIQKAGELYTVMCPRIRLNFVVFARFKKKPALVSECVRARGPGRVRAACGRPGPVRAPWPGGDAEGGAGYG